MSAPLRHAVRALGNAPGFTILSIATLALGIGAATAMFTVLDAVLLEPLAFPDAGRVVSINTRWPQKDHEIPRVTGGDFMDLRAQAKTFAAMSVYAGGEIGFRLRGGAQFGHVFFADPQFFTVLGASPAHGRLPRVEDAGHTAVVTAGFAAVNFGSAAGAIGKNVEVDNRTYELIGVVPDTLAFPEKAQLWITAAPDPQSRVRSAFNYHAIGRVRPNAGIDQAKAELGAIGARLAAAYHDDKGKTFVPVSLRDQLAAPMRTTLYFLFGAVGLLLLIACANVANMMLARATSRSREIAVRVALGSSASRIVAWLMTESAVLAGAGALVGIAIAWLGLRAMAPLLPANLPHAPEAQRLHPEVLLFAIAIAMFAVFASGLVPAMQVMRLDINEALKHAAARGFVVGAGRYRSALVIVEVALCCVLAVGAGLLFRTLLALGEAPLGYRTHGVLVMYADAPAYTLAQYLQAIRTFDQSLQQIRAIPGVRSAAAAMGLPAGKYGSDGNYLIEGKDVAPGQDIFKMQWPSNLPHATFALASPAYFLTMGIPLVRGRDFTERDQYEAPFTAVVSESLARQSFPGEDPIGRRIYCGLDSPKPMTIVGVVGDVRQDSPASRPEPEIYMPFQQHPYHANELQIVVQTDGDAARLAPAVRRTMHAAAPFVATKFTTMQTMLADSLAAPRFRATLALVFAALAIGLAVAGVYGIMAYFVAQRKAELGVRMALGAAPLSIVGLVLRRAFLLAACGAVVGLTAAAALSRVAASFLFEVRAADPVTYVVASLVVLAVAASAALLPALRASRIDPVIALREE